MPPACCAAAGDATDPAAISAAASDRNPVRIVDLLCRVAAGEDALRPPRLPQVTAGALALGERIGEALLHRAERLDEFELLALGTLAIDQLPAVRRGDGDLVGIGVLGRGLAVGL